MMLCGGKWLNLRLGGHPCYMDLLSGVKLTGAPLLGLAKSIEIFNLG